MFWNLWQPTSEHRRVIWKRLATRGFSSPIWARQHIGVAMIYDIFAKVSLKVYKVETAHNYLVFSTIMVLKWKDAALLVKKNLSVFIILYLTLVPSRPNFEYHWPLNNKLRKKLELWHKQIALNLSFRHLR